MRVSKMTPEARARCEQIADLKHKLPSYKDLEVETGVKQGHLRKEVFKILRKLRLKPRE